MRRARLLLAELLLRGARILSGAGAAGSSPKRVAKEEEEDDDSYRMPIGHPVVMRSAVAESMIVRSSEFRQTKKEEPEPPLRGSLQARFGVRR